MSLSELSPQQTNILQRSMFRAVDLIQNFFPAKWAPGKLVVLDVHQKDFIDCIQYGFPLRHYKFSEFLEKKPPKGIITIWRRQVGKSWSCALAAAALMIIEAPCSIGIVAASEDESQLLTSGAEFNFLRFKELSTWINEEEETRLNFIRETFKTNNALGSSGTDSPMDRLLAQINYFNKAFKDFASRTMTFYDNKK